VASGANYKTGLKMIPSFDRRISGEKCRGQTFPQLAVSGLGTFQNFDLWPWPRMTSQVNMQEEKNASWTTSYRKGPLIRGVIRESAFSIFFQVLCTWGKNFPFVRREASVATCNVLTQPPKGHTEPDLSSKCMAEGPRCDPPSSSFLFSHGFFQYLFNSNGTRT